MGNPDPIPEIPKLFWDSGISDIHYTGRDSGLKFLIPNPEIPRTRPNPVLADCSIPAHHDHGTLEQEDVSHFTSKMKSQT